MPKFSRDNLTEGIFPIEGKPENSLGNISRHGQYARILSSRKCPCISNGYPENFCELCNGIGWIYYFSRKFRILEESHPYHKSNRVELNYYPIIEVEKISRFLADFQGGNDNYTVDRIQSNIVYFSGGDNIPKDYERLKVTYTYDRWTPIYNENSKIISGLQLEVTGAEINTEKTHNPQEIFGDIAEVVRVRNKTKNNYEYTVDKYFKQTILIKQVANMPAISEGDILEVDYYYCPPELIIAETLKVNDPKLKWGDVEVGDVEAVMPYYIQIKPGDVVTFLFADMIGEFVIVRGSTDIDLMPVFDISRIDDNIIDSAGNTYQPGVDFIIYDYNKIKWIGNSPEENCQYNIQLSYKPSYIVFDQKADLKTSENKQFPKFVHLKKYNRLNKKDLSVRTI